MVTRVSSSVLANTTVTTGTYGGTNSIPIITVDQQGRLTYAANTAANAAILTTGTLDVNRLPNSGVSANTYGGTNGDAVVVPIVKVDQFGRTTLAANNSAQLMQYKAGGTIVEFSQVITDDYTITDNRNALSAGPIEILDSATVTIPENSNWTIV